MASGSATDLVLDEEDRAELLGTLEDWRSEGEFADEPRWLYMALVGERLPWEVWPGSGP
ncbi:MAG: hypothetical protein ACRDOG_07440 [Gaiellaceae bacterium]